MTPRLQSVPAVRVRRRRSVAVIVGALMALSLGSVPVSATIVERNRFTAARTSSWLGLRLSDDRSRASRRHKVLVRADRKVDGLVYVTDNYAFKETWTAADGRSFALSATRSARMSRPSRSADRSTEFTFQAAGPGPVDHRLVRTRHRRGSREHLVRLHDRPRGRELLQLPGRQALRAASRVRDRPVQARRSRSPERTRRTI